MTDIIHGVDVSATTLDARIGRDGEYRSFDVSTDGIADPIAFARPTRSAW